jgi:hypothetical protein
MRFGLVTGFVGHLQKVITNNYGSLTELHTHKVTVTLAHIKSSQSSVPVALLRLPTADVSFPLGSGTVTGFSYQLLTSHNNNFQLTLLNNNLN